MTAPHVYKSARPAYLTAEAFAQHFGISDMTAYRLMHNGELKFIRIGRSMRIPVEEVERFKKDAELSAEAEVWGEA